MENEIRMLKSVCLRAGKDVRNTDVYELWGSLSLALQLLEKKQEPIQVKLPKRMDVDILNTKTHKEKSDYKPDGYDIVLAFASINQLINYCESLQSQITELKERKE